MARISGADPKKKGFFGSLLIRVAYRMTKKMLGRVVMPVQITAHHTRLFWGYAQMEKSLQDSRMVLTSLKDLAGIRAATLIGCPY